MDNLNLTAEEQKFIDNIQAEMEFFSKYKDFMREVKAIFLNDGPEAAKKYIRDSDDHLLQIACDEMFRALMTKL